jgi:apolipoprotein N-acyltransferase
LIKRVETAGGKGQTGAMGKKTLLLSVVSGVLLFLSFPKFDLSILVWFSLVPLFFALQKKSLGEAFWIGLAAGLAYNIGILYWVSFVVVQYGYLPLYLGIFIMLLLALYLSLYVSLFSAGIVYFKKKGFPEIVVAPVLWSCLEYAKSHLLTGFPWENLAYSLHDMISFIQIIDISGVYGLTFVIVLVNCVLYDVLSIKVETRKRVLSEFTMVAVAIILIFSYGLYRLDQLEHAMEGKKSDKVASVQGNIDQTVKWNNEYQNDTLEIYRNLSLTSAKSGTRLIVWPETAAPFFFQTIDDKHRFVINIAKEARAYLLFGSPSYKTENGMNYFSNSAYIISPAGDIAGRYDKMHLVPYGEYVPLRKVFFFLEKLVVGVGDFRPGRDLTPLVMDGEKIGVLICYEGIFPEISRQYHTMGVTLLVNITNDAWFGTSSAPYQHLTMTAFRAVENRLYIIRAANTGISALIKPTGEIISQTGLYERTILIGTVTYLNLGTFYARYGDIFIYMCFITITVIGLISLKRRSVDDRRYFRSNT